MSKILTKEVSFSLAKLLKRKNISFASNKVYDFGKLKNKPSLVMSSLSDYKDRYVLAPTIAEVIDWIYENYGIWITVNIDDIFSFYYTISIKNKSFDEIIDEKAFDLPSQAYEKAIEHTLKELVK